MARATPDAVVVGSGPNGLAAAITLARARRSVALLEANPTIGGGCRSMALTLPGFRHDLCSAAFPVAAASAFFRDLPLDRHGLTWIHPPVPLAHPLDDGTSVLLHRSVAATAANLGPDARAYRRLIAPLVPDWRRLSTHIFGPLVRLPHHPLALARFGLSALWPARTFATRHFEGPRARALFAGTAAHSISPLEQPLTASFSILFALLGHVAGWPIARGGAQTVADALASYFQSLGGALHTDRRVRSLDDLPPAACTLFDLTPRQLDAIAGDSFPHWYRRRLQRFRYGPGVFKVDYALDAPVPWASPDCAQAGTLHLGGTLEEIADSERAVARGEHPDRPFVLASQPSLFDSTRAPTGLHTLWAYCHVPHGSTLDVGARIDAQIERFAPGFSSRVLARSTRGPADFERENANHVGGDIGGGANDVLQLVARPTLWPPPYRTPSPHLFLCSASTPPGGGVHGLCGLGAARAALRRWHDWRD